MIAFYKNLIRCRWILTKEIIVLPKNCALCSIALLPCDRYSTSSYTTKNSQLAESAEYENELNDSVLDGVAIAIRKID
jgi:hypothetical protein